MLRRAFRYYSSSSIDKFQEGKTLNGFICKQRHYIKELDTTVLRLKHVKSGANYIHLYRDDPNSVFAIGFKTIPADSTGVPHILEHTVLCGSEKYPVRDPFFKMLNRSLSNYMNAWTASDHTFYPFATEHSQDHANLRDIYFDAVFNPLLKRADFQQEGWRLCPRERKLKGVVLNEMKGAMSDAEAIFNEVWQSHVYAGTCYAHNSGGDPAVIPQLTHKGLVDFYKSHYTPGNALFVGYGKLMEDNCEYLGEKLAKYELSNGQCPNMRHLQPLPRDPVLVEGPIDPMGDLSRQHRTLMAWRCNDIVKHQESFHWQLLSHLLIDGPTAPLYDALIESGLGTDFVAGTGYHTNAVMSCFGVGLQGVKEKDVPVVHEEIQKTIKMVIEEGIPQDRIDSTLHQIQLSLKYKSASFGLNMAASVMSGWTRGVYPVEQLSITEKVDEFLRRLQRKPVLEPLLQKWVASVDERLLLTMRPDPQYNEKLIAKEKIFVESMLSQLSPEEIAVINKENEELDLQQKQRNDNIDSILPILKISDVSAALKTPSLIPTTCKDNIEIYLKETPAANGLSYFKILKQFDQMPPHPHLLPLAIAMFTEFGPTTCTFEEYEEAVKMSCSGYSISHLVKSAKDFRLIISTHCLEEKANEAVRLLSDTLNKVDYSRLQRLKTQIASTASQLSNAVSTSGHQYAMSAALSRLPDEKYKIKDIFGGLVQAELMQTLSQLENDRDLNEVIAKINEIHQFLINGPGKVRVSCVSSSSKQADIVVDKVAKSLTGRSAGSPLSNNEKLTFKQYENVLVFPMNTKYAAAAFTCNATSIKEKAALILAGDLLKSKFLHREIRESGGAYGAGASFNHLDNVFTFYSYRDPSPERSLEKFKESLKWLQAADLSCKELDEAKLSVISGTDAPKDLGEEGMALFKLDITDEERAELRQALLTCTTADIKAASQSLLSKGDGDWSQCIIKSDK